MVGWPPTDHRDAGSRPRSSWLVLGTVFDARDLLVYVISVAVMSGADVAMVLRSSQKMDVAN
ncbi:hypothetical protein GCM10023152_32490 [Agromyces bauzanensis]|uniref:Uncharacterized protein n=1 Tax=Agromyces bauzanensis TaxID=1308924 RepID=A0A917PBI3_9MICO|nr:hypothetical protein GCM10011372_04440 [Agromyces bauzanensis]